VPRSIALNASRHTRLVAMVSAFVVILHVGAFHP